MNLAGRARDPTKARVGGWKFANSNFQDAKQSKCNFFTQDRILQQQDCMLSIPYPIHPLEVSWIHSWDTYGYMISIHPFLDSINLSTTFPCEFGKPQPKALHSTVALHGANQHIRGSETGSVSTWMMIESMDTTVVIFEILMIFR